jgi:hypothetical protein
MDETYLAHKHEPCARQQVLLLAAHLYAHAGTAATQQGQRTAAKSLNGMKWYSTSFH